MVEGNSEGAGGTGSLYGDKPDAYFSNARHDIVSMMTTGAGAAVLEIGCGAGDTGAAVLAAGKASTYVGIEISPEAGAIAAGRLTEVLAGDVEALDLSRFAGKFDVLIASEVLEHLIDPWAAVAKLVRCLKPGATVYASSPNIAHWQVLRAIAGGAFDYTETGVFDRTHLRWFTPRTYREMFEAEGVAVQSVGPIAQPGWKGRLLTQLSGKRLAHLFAAQIMLVGTMQ